MKSRGFAVMIVSTYFLIGTCALVVRLPSFVRQKSSITRLTASTLGKSSASRGMGMGAAQKSSKKSKSFVKQQQQQPFDVNASLLRLEKKYDELAKASAKSMFNDEYESDDDFILSEYIVTARVDSSRKKSDWVPIAQIGLGRTRVDMESCSHEVAKEAVSVYRRELGFLATMSCRSLFQAVPRNELLYAIEPVDSFHKHVYDVVVQQDGNSKGGEGMSRLEALSVLGLDSDAARDRSVIKQQYRKLSFSLHPDRLVGEELTELDREKASEEYTRVKLAYEKLNSGVRWNDVEGNGASSWYASLGGRSRTDFIGPIVVDGSMDAAKASLDQLKVQTALATLDPDMVQLFVARSQANY